MSWLKMFDKIDDIIFRPIDTICNIIDEPSRRWEHSREIEKKDREVKREIERENAAKKIQSEISETEKVNDLKRYIERKAADAENEIKLKTEIKKAISEIEEIEKDKDVQRKKEMTEAFIKYKEQLARLNDETIENLGVLMIELRGKAHDLILEKTKAYIEIQTEAKKENVEQFKMIRDEFSDEPEIKKIMIESCTESMTSIVRSAGKFIEELNNDLNKLTGSLNDLAKSGNMFIEDHLRNHYGGSSLGIETKNEKIIEYEPKEIE